MEEEKFIVEEISSSEETRVQPQKSKSSRKGLVTFGGEPSSSVGTCGRQSQFEYEREKEVPMSNVSVDEDSLMNQVEAKSMAISDSSTLKPNMSFIEKLDKASDLR